MKSIKLFLGIAVCAVAMTASAQKVDFDNDPDGRGIYTEAGYVGYTVKTGTADRFEVSGADGRAFAVELNVGNTKDATLKAVWEKGCVTRNSKLVGDGVGLYRLAPDGGTAQFTGESVTMNIVLTGLPAGKHTLMAYLNANDGGLESVAPVDVAVNGRNVLTDVAVGNRAQAAVECGQAYVSFTAEEGKPVTVSLTSKPETGRKYGTTGVFVSAIEIDCPNPKLMATSPYPAHLDYHADADGGSIGLKWHVGEGAVKSVVYVGTSVEGMEKVAETSGNTYILGGLEPAKSALNTYYWRVDEVGADGNVARGDTWQFRPRRLAFPGAEGYGRFAIGGRGGVVYHVTSLDDYADGEKPILGTFRYGVKEVKGPRTIVFDVSGTIHLKERLGSGDPYVTVAGQTAPGNGILFRGAPFGSASDGITRFIRVRRGWHNDDAADMNRGLDGLGMAGNTNSIMDHCSVGWTIDEAFSSRNAKNITLQRTLISEALNDAHHPNYPKGKKHGFAATIGGDTATYHHNLLAHNEGRNWSLSGGLDSRGYYAGHHDVFNNVVYNWGGRATDGGTHECNFVANYYKMGPSSTRLELLTAELEGTGNGSQSYYVDGNIRENLDGTLTHDKEGVTYKYKLSGKQVLNWDVFVDAPFFESHATIEPAQKAFKTVLSDVGANQPCLDRHDRRMISETLSGTTSTKGSSSGKIGLIDRETDSEGFGYFEEKGVTRPAGFDTDKDGMPDWWEVAMGLNPDVADNNKVNADGYTALEEYLNWLAEPHYAVVEGSKIEVDLKALFVGFDNKPNFSFDVPTGFSIKEKGGVMVIKPLKDAKSLVTIPVTVTDKDENGYKMTRNINIYVERK